ncbi:hypothetical protein Dimus_025926 [Dionaea muscipula]
MLLMGGAGSAYSSCHPSMQRLNEILGPSPMRTAATQRALEAFSEQQQLSGHRSSREQRATTRQASSGHTAISKSMGKQRQSTSKGSPTSSCFLGEG